MTTNMAFLVSAGILLFTASAAHLLGKAEPRGFAQGFHRGTATGCLVGTIVMLVMFMLTGEK